LEYINTLSVKEDDKTKDIKVHYIARQLFRACEINNISWVKENIKHEKDSLKCNFPY